MKMLHSIEELGGLKGPIVLAAGTFDGLHLGHQALIRRAMQEASDCGGTAVVMTFDRHPAALLRPEKTPKLLTRNNEKIALLEGMGVQALLMLEFRPGISSPHSFPLRRLYGRSALGVSGSLAREGKGMLLS